jgi:beta-mannosidase
VTAEAAKTTGRSPRSLSVAILPSRETAAVSYCGRVRRVTSLNQNWEFSCAEWQKAPGKVGFSVLEWQRATVPGHVHLDLAASGIIANPFERLHELGCQWVDEENWHYRTQFEFVHDPRLPRRILRFEGLDTVCRLYLNGKPIGFSDNMFVALEIDVSNELASGPNQLLIEFDSALRIGRQRRERYFLHEGLAPTTTRFDPRAFVRKSQYMFGWDWGPRLISAGIWRPLALIEYAMRILDVAIVQRHMSDGTVEIEFQSEFEGSAQIYHFVEGFAEPIRDGETLRIERPRRWWPSTMGRPDLYRVISVLADSRPRSPSDIDGAFDMLEQRIGLRSVELVREPDAHGESFRFKINGHEFYALGANWIPDHSFPSQVDRERLRCQLLRARDLEMNMLRVWGGGCYESDDFYDLCDELGLLVWQDFPYACSYYPDDEASCDAARREARLSVRRLRNHPCLAIWCGNNENQIMRDSGWDGASLHPERYHGERLYDGVLPDVLAQLDPVRAYITSSPHGKEQANSGRDGDQHFWDVWHGRGDWKYYVDSDARFCSEFGFASAPGREVWHAIDPQVDLLSATVRDRMARWRDKTGKGYEPFVGLVELHYPKSESLEDWCYYSQLNQRDALRFGIEHYRRSEFCRGALIWQLNDCWPVQSWSVIDSAFRYKAAAFELRRLYAPLLASLERIGDEVRLWGVLDNVVAPRTAAFVVEVRSLVDGLLLERREFVVQLAPGERRILDTLNVAEYDPTGTIVLSEVEGRKGFMLLCEPKQLNLAASEIAVTYVADGLIVEVNGPVVDLGLFDRRGECEFVDNFVTLAAAGRCRLHCLGTPKKVVARSLAGFHQLHQSDLVQPGVVL